MFFLGQVVQFYRLSQRVSPEISKKVGQVGVVRGIYSIKFQGIGVIVEFKDNSRIWLLEEELRHHVSVK